MNKKTIHKDQIIASAIAGILALAATPSTFAGTSDAAPEKCYGISKAGANDCSAAGMNSCAGSAIKDRQGDAFIFMPKGLCERISGSNLNPIKENKT